MKRKAVHVTYRQRGKWAVKVQGNSRASSTHRKKRTAVNKGRKKAKKIKKKKGKSELVIITKMGESATAEVMVQIRGGIQDNGNR